ncbi:MAG TPA: peptidylprolyl isomerase [Bacteroidales bacterium]|nr:peptidylprolyl isomerase [Bacteroidales bacterium]
MRIKIFVVFTLSFIPFLFAQNNVIDGVVAIVGDNIILKSDIENQFYQLKSQNRTYNNPNIKCTILEDFLFQKLLLNKAQKDSIEIPESEVNSNLDRRINYFISQVGSQQKLEDYFGKTILEIKADFKEQLRNQMMIEKMQNKITENIKVSPHEVKIFFDNLPKDSLYSYPDQYILQQIVVNPPVSRQEIWRIRKQLNEFRDRVEKGENFATLAILYSEDPGSAKKGGELGYVGRGDLDPDFAAAAFNLKTPGDISRIIKTKFGYHIIQLIDRQGNKVNLRHILLIPKLDNTSLLKAKTKLDSILTLIKKDSISFAEAARNFSDDEQTKNNAGIMINTSTGKTKFALSDLDQTTQDIVKHLSVGEISAPFLTTSLQGQQIIKIIKIKEKIPAHTMNPKNDYQDIQAMCLAAKKQKEINNWIEEEINKTYIHIDKSYGNCPFNYSWKK